MVRTRAAKRVERVWEEEGGCLRIWELLLPMAGTKEPALATKLLEHWYKLLLLGRTIHTPATQQEPRSSTFADFSGICSCQLLTSIGDTFCWRCFRTRNKMGGGMAFFFYFFSPRYLLLAEWKTGESDRNSLRAFLSAWSIHYFERS